MRIQALLLFLLCSFSCLVSGFSQEGGPGGAHDHFIKNRKEKTTAPPLSLGELLTSLQNPGPLKRHTDILFSISRHYANALKIDSAISYGEKIRVVAEAVNDQQGMGKYYLALANALFYRKKEKEAVQYLEKAVTLFSQHRDDYYLGLSYLQSGRQTSQSENFRLSRNYYHMAIPLLAAAGEHRDEQRAWYELGRSFYMTYETDSAAFFLLTALAKAEEMQDSLKIFNVSALLGSLYLISGNLDKAGKFQEYALENRGATTSKVQLRNVLGNYAEYLIIKNDFDKAGQVLQQYEQLNKMFGDPWGAIMLEVLSGKMHFESGRYPEALIKFREAYDRRSEIRSFTFDVKNIAFNLGRTEIKTGDYEQAILHLKHARALAKDMQFRLDEMESDLLLAEAFHLKKEPDSAYLYFKQYSFLKDSLLTLQKERAVLELTEKYEAEKNEQKISQLESEKKLYDYRLQLKMDEIEKQNLLDIRKTQQLALLSQQNEINRLYASEKSLALQFKEREMAKKQDELELLAREKQLQTVLAAKQSQEKKIAYGAGFILLLMGIHAYYRARQHKKLGRKLAASMVDLKQAQEQLVKSEKEKEAENIRVRISRDIHDEVGATLSGVALFCEMARQSMQQHREADVGEYLAHISANSKEMVEKMSDIVWSINPQNDSFGRIISRLQSYSVNLCAGKGIQLHLDIDESIGNYSPSMPVRRNMYMILKEAINNAVKYSGAKHIFFSIKYRDGMIEAGIRDDGCGFDIQTVAAGNGLANMAARAAEFHGRLVVDSSPGKGTRVCLQFGFHPSGGQLNAV